MDREIEFHKQEFPVQFQGVIYKTAFQKSKEK